MSGLAFTRRDLLTSGTAAATVLMSRRAFSQSSDPTDLTIQDAATLIRSGVISPVELARAYLERIENLDSQLNAFITVTGDLALQQARELEAELSRGRWRGPLHGIPVALKDNIDTAGILTTAASALFADRIPSEDAEVVRRLKASGAVLLGKLNMHEFALGGTSAVTHYGPVHNPWNLEYIPGGSSGGSAAAVAARLCTAALGTDTAASVRMPAAFCGIVALKATYGLVSIRGIIPLSESLDHCGPMCRTVGDTALMLEALAGYDPRDVSSIEAQLPSYSRALYQKTSGMRLGVPRLFYEGLDGEVEDAVQEALDVLVGMTAGVRDVELPAFPSFLTIRASEAYAYHSGFLEDPQNHGLYQAVTLDRLLAGAEIPLTAYVQARRELTLVRNAIDEVFDDVDLLITPTTPVLPRTVREAQQNELSQAGPDITTRNTLPFNMYGIPTISIPCGFSRSGLPIGLQLSGPRLGEVEVLALAHAYEQATDWHNQRPPLA